MCPTAKAGVQCAGFDRLSQPTRREYECTRAPRPEDAFGRPVRFRRASHRRAQPYVRNRPPRRHITARRPHHTRRSYA